MSVPVRVTPQARDDILQGEQYFEGRRAGLGAEFVDEVLATFDRIGDMPLGYGEVGEGVRWAFDGSGTWRTTAPTARRRKWWRSPTESS